MFKNLYKCIQMYANVYKCIEIYRNDTNEIKESTEQRNPTEPNGTQRNKGTQRNPRSNGINRDTNGTNAAAEQGKHASDSLTVRFIQTCSLQHHLITVIITINMLLLLLIIRSILVLMTSFAIEYRLYNVMFAI